MNQIENLLKQIASLSDLCNKTEQALKTLVIYYTEEELTKIINTHSYHSFDLTEINDILNKLLNSQSFKDRVKKKETLENEIIAIKKELCYCLLLPPEDTDAYISQNLGVKQGDNYSDLIICYNQLKMLYDLNKDKNRLIDLYDDLRKAGCTEDNDKFTYQEEILQKPNKNDIHNYINQVNKIKDFLKQHKPHQVIIQIDNQVIFDKAILEETLNKILKELNKES